MKVTKETRTKSSRAFQLTLNEPMKWNSLLDYLSELESKDYIVAAREKAPSTGHEHIHCYVHFKSPIRLSLAALQGAHVEKCFGSPQKNIEYVKKDGDIILEAGTPPKKGGLSIKEVKAISKEEREDLPMIYYNIVQKVNAEESKVVKVGDWHKEIKVTYIDGPSGAGKSRMAEKILKEEGYTEFNEVKFKDGFWHNVTDNCKAAIYDDFRDHHMKPNEFITFLDYNKHPLNVKGGTVQNNYERIIITSIQNLGLIYPSVLENEPRIQWERRIKEHIHIDPQNNGEMDNGKSVEISK